MKVAFLSESGFRGKPNRDFLNCRTDIAWQIALDAEHFPLNMAEQVKGYDLVIVIWPKLHPNLNSEGLEMVSPQKNSLSDIFNNKMLESLKENNNKIACMQEGPNWYFNDYDLIDQFVYNTIIDQHDVIFCHNEIDKLYYEGCYQTHQVFVLPTLMIEDTIQNVNTTREDRVMIGGNFCRWYGGFQSYIVAAEFGMQMYIPSMHNKRVNEERVFNLNHLPYLNWNQWINELARVKYSVHLMPTVAAGTFSLNNAFLGIPCIGNEEVDTQRKCFPLTSVNVNDIKAAIHIAKRLRDNKDFYEEVSVTAKENYKRYFSESTFLETIERYKEKIFKE